MRLRALLLALLLGAGLLAPLEAKTRRHAPKVRTAKARKASVPRTRRAQKIKAPKAPKTARHKATKRAKTPRAPRRR